MSLCRAGVVNFLPAKRGLGWWGGEGFLASPRRWGGSVSDAGRTYLLCMGMVPPCPGRGVTLTRSPWAPQSLGFLSHSRLRWALQWLDTSLPQPGMWPLSFSFPFLPLIRNHLSFVLPAPSRVKHYSLLPNPQPLWLDVPRPAALVGSSCFVWICYSSLQSSRSHSHPCVGSPDGSSRASHLAFIEERRSFLC